MGKYLHYSLFVVCCIVGIAAQDCSTQVSNCALMMTSVSEDMSKNCGAFQSVETCLNNIKDKCSSDAMYQSIKSSLDPIKSMCTKSSSAETSAGGSVTDGTASCPMAASECFRTLGDVSDTSALCVNFQQFKTCWDPLEVRCGDDPTFASVQSQIEPAMALCGSDGCGISVLSGCSDLAQGFNLSTTKWNLRYLSQLCKTTETFEQTCIPKLESCPNLQEILKTYGADIQGSLDMLKQVGGACANLRPTSAEFSSCLNSDATNTKVEQCGDLTEDATCQSLLSMVKCTEMAVAEECGENAAKRVGSAISAIIRTDSEFRGQKCPLNTAAGLKSNQIIFAILINIVFYLI